jgi:hypothetical protein
MPSLLGLMNGHDDDNFPHLKPKYRPDPRARRFRCGAKAYRLEMLAKVTRAAIGMSMGLSNPQSRRSNRP